MQIIFNVKISQSTVPCYNRMGMVSSLYNALLNLLGMVRGSLSPRPQTNPSADCFQYPARYTGSDIRAGWGLGTNCSSEYAYAVTQTGLTFIPDSHSPPCVPHTHAPYLTLLPYIVPLTCLDWRKSSSENWWRTAERWKNWMNPTWVKYKNWKGWGRCMPEK